MTSAIIIQIAIVWYIVAGIVVRRMKFESLDQAFPAWLLSPGVLIAVPAIALLALGWYVAANLLHQRTTWREVLELWPEGYSFKDGYLHYPGGLRTYFQEETARRAAWRDFHARRTSKHA